MRATELIHSFTREIEIIELLLVRIDDGNAGYRPTPTSRSVLELGRYLCCCLSDGIERALGVVDPEAAALRAASAQATHTDLTALFARQAAVVNRQLAALGDADLARGDRRNWWGGERTLCAALVEIPLKWAVAYRMNLFLWLKESGDHDLDWTLCWKPPAPP